MMTSRLPHLIFGTGVTATASFALYHWRAMGGKGSLVRQIKIQEPKDPRNIFRGGDLFEIDVPCSLLLVLGKKEKKKADDPVQQLARAFFTAPIFQVERALLEIAVKRRWPQAIDPEPVFDLHSQHSMWTVIHRDKKSLQLEWGDGTKFGGFTNFGVKQQASNKDVVTLQFGSRLHSYDHPDVLNELHYYYSRLLLAQTAARLEESSSWDASSKQDKASWATQLFLVPHNFR